jgi:hypothetical protein
MVCMFSGVTYTIGVEVVHTCRVNGKCRGAVQHLALQGNVMCGAQKAQNKRDDKDFRSHKHQREKIYNILYIHYKLMYYFWTIFYNISREGMKKMLGR